jgi:hypothetical protein
MKEGERCRMLSNSSYLTQLLVEAHIDDLRRDAARAGLGRSAKEGSQRPSKRLQLPITIRVARRRGVVVSPETDEPGLPSV